jgi:hypothetical protein
MESPVAAMANLMALIFATPGHPQIGALYQLKGAFKQLISAISKQLLIQMLVAGNSRACSKNIAPL